MPSMSSYKRYYEVISQIPRGRVSTYGTVATVAGLPGRARQVGYALAALPDEHDIPWHRVINAKGELSRRSGGTAFEQIQRILLKEEGIRFDERGRVDLEGCGWP
jgi:methylated-DNA-protein-cysteine methyltransferase-like protein